MMHRSMDEIEREGASEDNPSVSDLSSQSLIDSDTLPN